ncbi:MAG: GtrA family protein [Alphaproteobacteria bacterium]|nr:GtrA family protein [Alphaproteobacteria bacterium]
MLGVFTGRGGKGLAEIGRFGVVGTAGFLADAAVLWILVQQGDLPPVIARLFSFPPAFVLTWMLNRHWTFATGRQRGLRSQFVLYAFVQLSGLAVNYGSFALIVTATPFWNDHPVLALAIASIIAAVLTYVLSKVIAFGALKTPAS